MADTPIGRLGCAICYDWLFPEAIRQLAANGAEVLVRVSAYMDPWGATPPMDWWTVVNRCRALENMAYVVAANQGASLRHYPPFSWPGGSMVVDYDGRILAQADPGPGERIVVAPIDIDALRDERERRARPPHARAPAHRGLPRVWVAAFPARGLGRRPPARAVVRRELRADRYVRKNRRGRPRVPAPRGRPPADAGSGNRRAGGAAPTDANAAWSRLHVGATKLARNGIRKIILVNGHGGNSSFLSFFCQAQLARRRDYAVYLFQPATDPETDAEIQQLRRRPWTCTAVTSRRRR